MASVLIIDDDDAVRRMLRAALERAGHRVEEGRNGAEGMSIYRRAPADLVITDVFMPDQDGIETIQQLRAEFPASRILAISGGSTGAAAGPLTDARLLGANATLAKPFTLDRLSDTVRELLGE
ncbi:MAG TPA: response regulator [Longimicrobiales bacterium]